MSMKWQLNREIPEDTARLGRRILKPTNTYRQLGELFNELFPDETVFASMYEESGRSAISPLLLALVTVFQVLEKVPDRLAAEYVVSRIDWKYAMHLELTYEGFHFTDLTAFRERLYAHGQERLVMDELLARLMALGLLKKRGKVRSDSTHILGVVERLSQYELVAESLRVALEATLRIASAWVVWRLPEAFCESYTHRQSIYGLSEAKVKQRLQQVGQDGFWFIAQVDSSAPPSVRELVEVQTLRTVLTQQYPGGPKEPPVKRRPTGKRVIESPHEREVRFNSKRGTDWLGYKVQVSETCDADTPHLIVDLEPTGAFDNDSPETLAVQERLSAQQIVPEEHYVDQGYMSADNMVASAQQGINLMGVPLADTQGKPGFRQADFALDTAARQVTCPAGQRNRVWSEKPDADGYSRIKVRFDAKTCQACGFFGSCTRSQQGRSLTYHAHRAVLAERRALAQTPAFKARMRVRAGIEGTISELVRCYGLRRARYRGQAKLRLQAYYTAIAINLKRLVRWLTQPPRVTPVVG